MIRLLTAVAIVQLCFNVEGYSQHNVCIGDVIEIPLTGHKAGAIQWQFSNDLVTWTDLEGEVGDALATTVQETGYFRAEVTDNSCTYYSDTVNILAFLPPTVADAGEDQILTDGTTSFTLSANAPEDGHGTGLWSILNGEGGRFDDATHHAANFTGQLYESYELQWSILTSCDVSSDSVNVFFGQLITDIAGNIYQTVKIGNQIWMAENLKTTKYNDGTDIPLEADYDTWGGSTTPAYCWYDNDQATYGDTYGALYNWYTIETGNLCPAGWHVPAVAEWTQLTDYLNGDVVAGGKLKETGTTYWISPNIDATNESGFTALPGGFRVNHGYFHNVGNVGFWWSTTEYSAADAGGREVHNDVSNVYRTITPKEYGLSVRCLRDETP